MKVKTSLNLGCILVLSICIPLRVLSQRVETVKIQVNPKIVVNEISPDFIGLGYETSAVAQTNYFDAKNIKLIQLYRNLSPHGLIRIGGDVSDHTKYVPNGIPLARSEKETTIINHTSLVNLAGFARATGWKVMWGLNLGTGSKEQAEQEAKAVHEALGNCVQSFQIGNEVDHIRKYNNYNSYYSDYLIYKAAIHQALPQAKFSGPDLAGNLKWLHEFAETQAKDIQLLTYHYYRTGSKKPEATIETLLSNDDAWEQRLKQLQQISQDKGVPFRINEVNSFYGGGKAGVSDTYASALWCLDYMFKLASSGCNGVNMQTDINNLGWISHYSPIIHDSTGNSYVRPEYYGILAFGVAGNGELLKLMMDNKENINISAYATRHDRKFLWITLINKEITKDASVDVVLPEGYSKVMAFRLSAPSVKSKNHITLAGAEVSSNGKWKPKTLEKVLVKTGSVHLLMQHTSAVLLRLED